MKRFLGVLAVVALVATPAMADLYGFTKITSNGNPDVGSQLSVDVTGAGSQASFKFWNNVGIASSITDIYFDDGTLLGIASITDSGGGVAFEDPANPGNLPGGNAVSFTADFSADSNAPITANGVNSASEWVEITFNLINGKTFADTLAALGDGTLRIGLHVQGIGTPGGSDSYVNTIPHAPAPGAALLAMIGLGAVGWVKRRLA